MTHTLTDEICYQIQGVDGYPCDPQDMRSAADWQLEQVKLTGRCVINELHENNCHIEADNAAAFLEVLIGAMRPTQKTGREGALQALDRLYEENPAALKALSDLEALDSLGEEISEGLRRLAQDGDS
mgnify:CR=1 FL=1